MKIGKQFRTISVRDAKTEKETRMIEFPFSSETPVDRWWGKEILSHKKGSMDLERLNDGGALLWNHDSDTVIGVVEGADLRSDNRLWAKVRFSENPKAQEIWKDIEDGILKNVSFGYQIEEMVLSKSGKDSPDEYTATRWNPFEVSIVSIPADHSVGIGRADSDDEKEVKIIKPEGNNKMDEEQKKALEAANRANESRIRTEAMASERERMTTIAALGDKFNQKELARQLTEGGKSVEEARAAFLERLEVTQKPISDNDGKIGMSEKEVRSYSFIRAINALANPGNRKLQEAAAFEFEASAAGAKHRGKESQGLFVPYDVLSHGMKRDLSKGTPSAGGYLVGTDHMFEAFIELLRKKSILDRAGARILNGLRGDLSIPKQTGASTAYWVGEATAPTESAQTFGQVAMSPKTVGAFVDMSRKLLIQSSPDIEQLVKSDLAKVLALAIDNAGLYGSGSSSQPQGIAGGAFVTGLNTLDLASATEMTYPEAIGMETLIAADNADVDSMKYLASSVQRGGMKAKPKFASTDSVTVWQADNTINGYPALCSNQVSSADVFFGDWSQLILGFWSGLDLTVDPSALATAGGMRVIALQDMDVAVRHGESFCYANSSIS